jgi:acyl-coenzyme A thioesterase PaaI-like protein
VIALVEAEGDMNLRAASEGFVPHFRTSPVTAPWAPLFSRHNERSVEIGLWLREAHCNSRGFLHGGVIAALADSAMGLSCVEKVGADRFLYQRPQI